MRIKTSELSGRALSYAVGVAEGCRVETWHTKAVTILFPDAPRAVPWNPHSDWSQGGPIIEQERICIKHEPSLLYEGSNWIAEDFDGQNRGFGNTPLIAAMRHFVSNKLGDEVEIPEELL